MATAPVTPTNDWETQFLLQTTELNADQRFDSIKGHVHH